MQKKPFFFNQDLFLDLSFSIFISNSGKDTFEDKKIDFYLSNTENLFIFSLSIFISVSRSSFRGS